LARVRGHPLHGAAVTTRMAVRCVPDRSVDAGNSQSLPDSPAYRLTCAKADKNQGRRGWKVPGAV
ncbi:MAG: hypothetical protein ACLPQY_00845, partial [Streptosporangiaceae bacterium]